MFLLIHGFNCNVCSFLVILVKGARWSTISQGVSKKIQKTFMFSPTLKLVSAIFYFSPNDNLLETMKNTFYFI